MTGFPTARYLAPVAPLSDEWHAQRRLGIGGSDASIIMGFNRYTSILDLWQDKRSQVTPPDFTSEAAEWGRRLEPLVADRLEQAIQQHEDESLWLKPADATLQSTDRPHMLANLDRIVYSDEHGSEPQGIAEIKTVGLRLAGEWGDEGVAMHALWQGIHYMSVTSMPVCYFGALVGGQEFRYRKVVRDEVADLEQQLLDAEDEFWECVETGREPLVIDRNDGDALRRLHPVSEPDSVVDLSEYAELLDQWRMTDSTIKALTKVRDDIAVKVQQAIGDAEAGEVGGALAVTFKSNEVARLDGKALRAEMPEVADKFTIRAPQRRFIVKAG